MRDRRHARRRPRPRDRRGPHGRAHHRLVEEARLPDRVARRALAAFRALAVVEGRLHRRPPEQVHFHEVGGLDAIVDVVGTAAALEVLGVDDVRSSSVANGTGMVRAAHGLLPNPAPAVVGLLEGAPTHGVDVPLELTTPTGAALLAATVTSWGPLPAMRIEASGFGAGSREIDGRPNAVQVVVGQAAAPGAGPGDQLGTSGGQPAVLLEANLDDATGEVLAHAVSAAAGGRRARRLGHAGRHEEGPARPRGERPRRPGARRAGGGHAGGRDRDARRAGHHRRALAPHPARSRPSTSTACPFG